MNLLRKCYDMTDLKIGHSYQYDQSEFTHYLSHTLYQNCMGVWVCVTDFRSCGARK